MAGLFPVEHTLWIQTLHAGGFSAKVVDQTSGFSQFSGSPTNRYACRTDLKGPSPCSLEYEHNNYSPQYTWRFVEDGVHEVEEAIDETIHEAEETLEETIHEVEETIDEEQSAFDCATYCYILLIQVFSLLQIRPTFLEFLLYFPGSQT